MNQLNDYQSIHNITIMLGKTLNYNICPFSNADTHTQNDVMRSEHRPKHIKGLYRFIMK